MELKKITSEKEYNTALDRFEKIMFAEEGTPEDREAFLLGLIIEAYEEENFPIEEPDPIAYIDARLDALGLKQKDLVGVVAASEAHVSEVMNKKRALSLNAIRELEARFKLDPKVLIQRYEIDGKKKTSTYRHQKKVQAEILEEPQAKSEESENGSSTSTRKKSGRENRSKGSK